MVFLVVGLLDAIWELISSIRKDPDLGPVSKALKVAFCGCVPTTRGSENSAKSQNDEESQPTFATEKQNGAETVA